MSQPGVRGKYGKKHHDYFGWHQAYCGAPDAGILRKGVKIWAYL